MVFIANISLYSELDVSGGIWVFFSSALFGVSGMEKYANYSIFTSPFVVVKRITTSNCRNLHPQLVAQPITLQHYHRYYPVEFADSRHPDGRDRDITDATARNHVVNCVDLYDAFLLDETRINNEEDGPQVFGILVYYWFEV